MIADFLIMDDHCDIIPDFRVEGLRMVITMRFIVKHLRKWSYKTTSPIFKHIFKEVSKKIIYYLYNDKILFERDIGPTEIM